MKAQIGNTTNFMENKLIALPIKMKLHYFEYGGTIKKFLTNSSFMQAGTDVNYPLSTNNKQ